MVSALTLSSAVVSSERLDAVLMESFVDNGQATMERLQQDPVQQACHQSRTEPPDAVVAAVASELAGFNPNFDRARFVAAASEVA